MTQEKKVDYQRDQDKIKRSGERIRERKDVPPTKVVIRCLPPSLNEQDFLEQISPVPEYDYFRFVKADMSLGVSAISRAYINFLNQEDIIIFKEKFDGYVFLDNRGNEYTAIVEFAPFQKIPKKKSKKNDTKKGTIEQDVDYQRFLETILNAEPESIPPPESYLEEIEAREKFLKANHGVPKIQTPLLEYIKRRKEERKAAKQRARDARDRRETEKRKQREEERKRRKERERDKQRDKERQKQKEKDEKEKKKKDEMPVKLLKNPERDKDKPKDKDAKGSQRENQSEKTGAKELEGDTRAKDRDKDRSFVKDVRPKSARERDKPREGEKKYEDPKRRPDTRHDYKEGGRQADRYQDERSKSRSEKEKDRRKEREKEKRRDREREKQRERDREKERKMTGRELRDRPERKRDGDPKYGTGNERYDSRSSGYQDRVSQRDSGRKDDTRKTQDRPATRTDKQDRLPSREDTKLNSETERGTKSVSKECASTKDGNDKISDTQGAFKPDEKNGSDPEPGPGKEDNKRESSVDTVLEGADTDSSATDTSIKRRDSVPDISSKDGTKSSSSKQRLRYKDRPERAIYNPAKRAAERRKEAEARKAAAGKGQTSSDSRERGDQEMSEDN